MDMLSPPERAFENEKKKVVTHVGFRKLLPDFSFFENALHRLRRISVRALNHVLKTGLAAICVQAISINGGKNFLRPSKLNNVTLPPPQKIR